MMVLQYVQPSNVHTTSINQLNMNTYKYTICEALLEVYRLFPHKSDAQLNVLGEALARKYIIYYYLKGLSHEN